MRGLRAFEDRFARGTIASNAQLQADLDASREGFRREVGEQNPSERD